LCGSAPSSREEASDSDVYTWFAKLHAAGQLLPCDDDRLRDRAEAVIRLQRGLTSELIELVDDALAPEGKELRADLGQYLPWRVLAQHSGGMQEIWPPRRASGDAPFSRVVSVEERLMFLAGRGPIHNGTIVRDLDPRARAEVTLHNLAGCLARLGADKSEVISCTCYLADLADVDAFNAAYLEFFGVHRSARTTVQAQLIGGVGVDVIAVAALPPGGADAAVRPGEGG
jgi:2-iminobutanoate/2-iminopropanoate deaminase